MAIIAVGIVNRHGKVLLSRQFTDISRNRVEGLLSSFPRLLESTKMRQVATYIDGGSVRYVFIPFMNEFFLILLTEKANSNIVDDLRTLHLIGSVLPEYLPQSGFNFLELDFDSLWGGAFWNDEDTFEDDRAGGGGGAGGSNNEASSLMETALDNASLHILFALDEIVNGGKREDVTTDDIHTYLEMHSHEEDLYLEAKQQREAEAKKVTAEHARKIAEQKRKNMAGIGGGGSDPNYGGFGSDTPMSYIPPSSGNSSSNAYSTPSSYPTAPTTTASSVPVMQASIGKKGMSLGAKKDNAGGKGLMNEADMLAKIQKEVGGVAAPKQPPAQAQQREAAAATAVNLHEKGVHLHEQEHLMVTMQDGRVTSMDVKGELSVKINDPSSANIKILLESNPYAAAQDVFQYKSHARMNRAVFAQNFALVMEGNKPFPIQQPVTVLRWRLQTNQNLDTLLPITFTCWPEENSIIVEYELNGQAATGANTVLENVSVYIPIGNGSTVEEVSASVGEHTILPSPSDASLYLLQWTIPSISASTNANGNVEVRLTEGSEFFPIAATFTARPNLGQVHVHEVISNEDGRAVEFSESEVVSTEAFQLLK